MAVLNPAYPQEQLVSPYHSRIAELLVQHFGYSREQARAFTHLGKQSIQRFEEQAVDPAVIAERLAKEIKQAA